MKISDIPGCGSFGIFIDDIDFNNLSDDEWLEIGKLHLEKLVTIIRSTGLQKDTFYNSISKWGSDRLNYIATLHQKYPWSNESGGNMYQTLLNSPVVPQIEKDIILEFFRIKENNNSANILRVSGKRDENGNRIGMFAEGELLWHSNESGDIAFTPGVALLGIEGMTKSATGFMVTTDYYYSVSDSFRSELDEMVLIHNFIPGRINPGLNSEQDNLMYKNMAPDPDAEIPMVIESPGGIRGLHYSFNTVTGIKGMNEKESQKLLLKIKNDLEKEEYIYDHWYQNNDDLCLFDNSIVQHRRLGDTTNRLCLRYQYDYTHIQSKPYLPYKQKQYADKYINRMRMISDMMKYDGKTIPVPNKYN